MRNALFFPILFFLTAPAFPRDTLVRAPLQVVSMYTPEIFQAMKEKSEHHKICDGAKIVMLGNLNCKADYTKERVWRLHVFEGPSRETEQKGIIELAVSGKKVLELRYRRSGSRKWIPFKPTFQCNFMDSDCVAEQSILDRKGDWIEIPGGTMDSPGWFDFRHDLKAEPRVRPGILEGRSYVLARSARVTRQSNGKNQFLHQGEEFFVKKIEGGNLIVRRVQQGDEKCSPPKFELGQEPPEYAIHISELYDGKGQLRAKPAFADFCPHPEETERDLKL